MNLSLARRIVVLAAIAVLFGALAVDPTASAATGGEFRDDFDPAGYGGSDGTLSWEGPWAEVGESDGFLEGAARVKGGILCASESCLELGTLPGSNGIGVSRSLDLSGATSATLAFTYELARKAGSGAIVVSASASGAAPWVTVGRYPFDTAPLASAESIDISSFIDANASIRFTIEGDAVKSRMGIDDLVVIAAGGSSTTTTMPATTTTTTTMPATTTTSTMPATTTTTSTMPATTTTTMSVTTTTEHPIPVTATTVPWGTTTIPSTTTTVPWGTTTTLPSTTTTVASSPADPAGPSTPGSEGPAEPPTVDPPVAVRPTDGLALGSSALPPSESESSSPGPLTRVMASFVTTVGYAANPALTTLVLAAIVAWFSVKGLERAPVSRRIRLRPGRRLR